MNAFPRLAAAIIAALSLATVASVPFVTAAEPSETGSIVEAPITPYDRDHWSLLPLEKPTLPRVAHASWSREPLDFFILARLESARLEPAPSAERRRLLRRLTFDVIGLPPTPDEQHEFIADPDIGAYERQVDRLLASPAYGERWAQFWLDLARFAETDGFEHDKVRTDAWRYRDWVIQALNDDMPYDRFLRLQLAGDQVEGGEHRIATFFCTAGPDMPDINEQGLRRHDKLNELTSTVGSAVLGMQFHCAQCHDHKYDPISQADFYRLRAIFESSIGPLKRDQPVLTLEDDPESPAARLYYRGDVSQPGPVLPAGFPRLAVGEGRSHLCSTDSPRIEFSDWLVDRSNPLTARVIVNRLWQFHFGQSLCENPSDFGVIAGEPTHPELLDWLAFQLQDHQWSIKQLHRSLLLSATYRQQSRHEVVKGAEHTTDASLGDELYHGFPSKRLEGETLRDAMLAVSESLNRTMGGESVMPPLPPEMANTLLKGQWKTSANLADHARRSIYIFARGTCVIQYSMSSIALMPVHPVLVGIAAPRLFSLCICSMVN